MVIARLILFLFQVELTDLFMNVRCRQRLLANAFLPYVKTLQKGIFAVCCVATLLIQDTKVQKAISTGWVHNKFFLWTFGKNFLPDCEGFSEACDCFMRDLLFIVVYSDEEISVTGFD